MKLISYCNKVIEYSFYSLLFLVPLVFSGDTSELFEFNKMWLTFGVTAIIFLAWGTKVILEKRLTIQRTPLDIILLLFLLSQVISSIFTLDQHVSWWGYYSRFNGGLLSTFCYVFLYYAFVSNFPLKITDERVKFSTPLFLSALGIFIVAFLIILGIAGQDSFSLATRPFIMGSGIIASLVLFIWSFQGPIVYRILFITLCSGLVTALWGFPAHFGLDPTCQLFQGKFDVSCWTDAFRPVDRTFSTLGQPAWMAAYMAMLLPLAIGATLYFKQARSRNLFISFFALTILFYLSLLFTNTRAAFIAYWVAHVLFWGTLLYKRYLTKTLWMRMFVLFTGSFLICNFFFNTPIAFLNKLTLAQLTNHHVQLPAETISGTNQVSAGSGITDSGNIRLLVWQGALRTWENNPIFGTGVETYAFDYYKYKSPAHNLTSEWDYLYNKAHNEYLNYLATTGIVGLGTYVIFLLLFIFFVAKWCWRHTIVAAEHKNAKITVEQFDTLEVVALTTGWITILITNFFGFSVVIMNLYLFLIPLFVFILIGKLQEDRKFVFPTSAHAGKEMHESYINPYQWTALILLVIIVGWMEIGLAFYRQADIAYAYGNNLDKIGSFGQATQYLLTATQTIPDEPVYKDELSINLAAIAAGLYEQKDTSKGDQIAKNAQQLSDEVVTSHPNNVVYWKNRVRLFYTLSSTDPKNQAADLEQAVHAIDTAKQLAPTDAKIAYNQAVLYGQSGQPERAARMLEDTIKLKPDYVDVYVALGVFYHQMAVDKSGRVIKPEMQKKAIATYEYILKNLSPDNKEVKKNLEQWRSE